MKSSHSRKIFQVFLMILTLSRLRSMQIKDCIFFLIEKKSVPDLLMIYSTMSTKFYDYSIMINKVHKISL